MSLSLLAVVLSVKSFVLSMVLSAGFLVVSIFAMRRQRLREHTALLWLLVSVVMVFVSVTLPTDLLTRVSDLVGIAYSPAFVLLLAVLFLMVLVFQLSLSVDRLSAKQTATGPGDRAPDGDVADEPRRRDGQQRRRRTGHTGPPKEPRDPSPKLQGH